MRVAIVGTGYVGLVSGVCLAAKGHRVTCVDIKPSVVQKLSDGIPHIHELGLSDLLRSVISSGLFDATTDLFKALELADMIIVAVGTPVSDGGGSIELGYVEATSRDIATYLKFTERWIPVVIKSTVLPGTTDTLVKEIIESGSGRVFPNFGLGMNPEFLREGNAVQDFLDPDRIVIGHEDPRTLSMMQELYEPWSCEKVVVNSRTAEFIKYANNILLATQISAVNELANLSAVVGGIDILDVIEGVTLDKRWRPLVDGKRVSPGILSYLIPGCGFGGSCFPKDLKALHAHGHSLGLEMSMLNSVLEVNRRQPSEITRILASEVRDLRDLCILVMGLAFKPGTDDVRESVSVPIIQSLLNSGANVLAHDPIAIPNFSELLREVPNGLQFVNDWRSSVSTADVIIVTCAWPEYRNLLHCDVAEKVVLDARRMFSPREFPESRYLTVGVGYQ